MRVKSPQHVTDYASRFDRLGPRIAVGAAKAQTHARHRIQNAPLDRFLAIANIGQSAALDHTQGVFQVGTLRVSRQIQSVITLRLGRWRNIKNKLISHKKQNPVSGIQKHQDIKIRQTRAVAGLGGRRFLVLQHEEAA